MKACEGADVLVVLTEWSAFALVDLHRVRDAMAGTAVVDARNLLDPAAARAAGLGEIAVFLSASETHNKKNVNKTIDATLDAFVETIGPAREAGMRVRLQTARSSSAASSEPSRATWSVRPSRRAARRSRP